VIQCAAQKRAEAGYLKTRDGRRVLFVADPTGAPFSTELIYARPDDPSDTGVSWRETLVQYNQRPDGNPLRLYPAAQLYSNPTYGQLLEHLGTQRMYILSAGWGLIGASFLTPYYDITFSMTAQSYKRRKKGDHYRDLCMLPDSVDPIVFFGGKDYIPLFCELTKAAIGRRTIFYNSNHAPKAPGCSLVRFATTTRTNWHYECAREFIAGHPRIRSLM
jgi:hypothetical protein